MSKIPSEIPNVTLVTKANVYFDGGVVSHTFRLGNNKKTLGIIRPGKYHFSTDKAERMEVVCGACRVRIDGASETRDYAADEAFEVPAESGFDIEVSSGRCEYICSFLP